MGAGSFANGKFQLTASFKYDASQSQIDQWKNAFQYASSLLFHATKGQMQIAGILYGNDSAGQADADILLMELDCVSNDPACASRTRSQKSCPGTFSKNSALHSTSPSYIKLFHDETRRPYVIVHEFGHYALCLADEYYNRLPICAADAAGEHSCFMEFPYTHGLQLHPDGSVKSVGDVNNFCCQLNHDGTTAQLNGQLDSCWDIIAKKYADHGVMPPPPGQHPGSPPSTVALEELVWQPMASTTRTLFFAGNDPGNLANSDALSFVKNVLSNLRDVTQPAWTVDAELRIFDKQYTDATHGNQSLLSMIDFFRNATRASRNNVIWISGTVEPAFHDADNLGTQLRRNRIRFHSIIPATSKGVRSSYELSQRSHGSLRVLVSLDPKLEALHLGSQLLATAVESVEHFAVLENESFCLRGTRVPLAQDAPSAVHHSSWMRGRISPLRAELPTLIESDAEAVVFGFLNREGDQVQYSVLLPDGKRVPIAEIQGAVRVSPPHSGLTAVIIDHPQPGSWVMIAERFDDENRHATGNLFCAVRNRQLLAVLSVTRMASLSIEIEAVAVADTELIHLEPAFAIVEFLKNDGNWETRHIAQLLPQNPSMVERGGDLVAVVRVLCSGTYRISTRLTNLGNARGTPGTEPGVELSLDSVASNAPVFTRLLQKVVAID